MPITRRQALPLFALSGLAASAAAIGISKWDEPGIVTPALAEDLSTLMDPGPLKEMVLGDEEAPVTIVEYASLTCGHCASFHRDTLPAIKEKYIETGKAKLYMREFPFDPRATAAIMLARCAPEGSFFPMVDILFQQQSNWARSTDVVTEFRKIAKLAGFTQESFDACLKNQQLLDNVRAVRKKAEEDYGGGRHADLLHQRNQICGQHVSRGNVENYRRSALARTAPGGESCPWHWPSNIKI